MKTAKKVNLKKVIICIVVCLLIIATIVVGNQYLIRTCKDVYFVKSGVKGRGSVICQFIASENKIVEICAIKGYIGQNNIALTSDKRKIIGSTYTSGETYIFRYDIESQTMEKYILVSEIAEQLEMTIMYAEWYSDDGRYVNSFLSSDERNITVQFDLETGTYEIMDAISLSCVEESEQHVFYTTMHTFCQYDKEGQQHEVLLEHVGSFKLSDDGDRIIYVTPMEVLGNDDYGRELYCYEISSGSIIELTKVNSQRFKIRDFTWLGENYAYVKSCSGLEGEAFIAIYTQDAWGNDRAIYREWDMDVNTIFLIKEL